MSNKDYFDRVASQWDQMRQSFYSDAVREKALNSAGVQAGEIAVDIGAGSGFITEGLVAKGLRVIAVDQSEGMLTELRHKFHSVPTVEARKCYGEQLPILDDAVDYVFANMFLHHVESPLLAIREMARVLKSGGKLVITDLDEHSFDFLRQEHHDRWMGFKREDIGQWFIKAGLRSIHLEDAGESCCAQSECGTQSADVSIFLALCQK